ncbi:MAG TPA: hypothetical protein ENN66_07300 [Proteobacteria bacterium]|nr:hypothetical protein [Pseudomonadota bacterium]
MSNKKLFFLLLAAIIGWSSLAAAEDKAEGKIEINYHGSSVDDSLNKTAEYESVSPSAGGALEIGVRKNDIGIELKGRYTDDSDMEAGAEIDIKRMICGSFSYQEFIHRLRHDSMFEDQPHAMATATNAFPQSIEHWIDTNGDGVKDSPADTDYDFYDGVIAANPVPVMTEAGVIALEGMQTAIFNDLDQGRDYMIERRQSRADLKVQLPFFPYLTPEIRYSHEEKRGWKQSTLMTGQCTPCHTIGVGQRVDQTTEDLSLGATFKKSGLTASYFHTERDFNSHSNDYSHQGLIDNTYWYDTVVKGSSTSTFMSRELFENDRQQIGVTADIKKKMDTVKVRYDSPVDTTIYGSYVRAKTENNYNNLDYQGDTLYFSVTNRSINGLHLQAHAKQYSIDSDDLYVDLTSLSNNAAITFTANGLGTVPVSYFNYNRPSSLSRDVLEAGFNASYFFRSGYTLTGAYTHKIVDRDEDSFKEYDNSLLLDEKFLADEKTIYDTLKLSLSARPLSSLNLRLKYEYEHADKPFSYANGLGFNDYYENGWTLLQNGILIENPDTMETNTAFYQILRSGY